MSGNKANEFRCPVCRDSDEYSNARVAFAHLIWKHPKEYWKLKRATVERNEMVRKANYENVADVLKAKIQAVNCPPTSNCNAQVQQTHISDQNTSSYGSVHSTSNVIVKCNWCPFTSNNCEQVAEHDLMTHVSVRRYHCSCCQLLFIHPFEMCVHFRVIHNQVVKYCANCGDLFDDDAKFCVHLVDECRKFLIAHYEKQLVK